MKKITALLLAFCLMAGMLSGCGSTEIRSYSEDGGKKDENARDMAEIYAKYEPETVVMTVGGEEVAWGEFFYWLNAAVTSADAENGSPVEDWSVESNGTTLSQNTLDIMKIYIVQYHALNANAARMGVSLSDEDKAAIQANMQADIVTYCGEGATEEDFNKYLETLYMPREYYDYINSTSVLYNSLFAQTQGADGEKVSDEDAMAYAVENGYMSAKHILFSTVDAEGNALSEEEKAEKLKQAQAVSDELQSISDAAAREARFDVLGEQYNEDTGKALYPNGYCFTDGQMVAEFQSAVEELSDYEVSEPVESVHGYHVILKKPTTPDSEVSYVSEGVYRTLRYYAAAEIYTKLVSTWIDEAEVEWQGEFAELDLGKLLKV